MATLAISIAVSVAVSLALNALFPPPDVVQEGPRLTDLDFSSSTYGQFINIPFGTNRMAGNIIWANPIEEVRNEEDIEGGKGLGGPSISRVTYTYFATFDISFAVSGADSVLRIWADGKLIVDRTGTGGTNKAGVNYEFYPGGAAQQKDTIEQSFLTEPNTPAYRHLTRIVFNRLPLIDFGNRIPNITAELTFNGIDTVPFTALTEVPSMGLPGDSIDRSPLAIDYDINSFISQKQNSGLWRADLDSMTVVTPPVNLGAGANLPGYGFGFFYQQLGVTNSTPLHQIDVFSGKSVAIYGVGTTSLTEQLGGMLNSGSHTILRAGNATIGFVDFLFHLTLLVSTGIGSIINTRLMNIGRPDNEVFIDVLSNHGIASHNAIVVADDVRGSGAGVAYVVAESGADTQITKFEFVVSPSTLVQGELDVALSSQELLVFTFPTGSGTPLGWAVHSPTGNLIISNDTSTVLFDPSTSTIMATSLNGFRSINNYADSSIFATAENNGVNDGIIRIWNTGTLETKKIIDLGTIGLTGNEVIAEASTVWDARSDSIIISRTWTASSAPVDQKVIRVFVNRVNGLAVTLSSIVASLSTTYQDIPMANLPVADFDVSTLTSDLVEGYNINRQSSIRSALEPLRRGYFFDGIESDWQIKFPKRGGAPVLTIPEEDVGLLRTDDQDPNFVKETRTQETDLPMRLSLRYVDRSQDYSLDVEHARRMLNPNPTMRSKDEQSLDVPIVFPDGTIPKQAAEQWLYTIWNERKQVSTVIPWTYLKLDAGDVFNMGLFGETLRLRMGEQDVGVGFPMEIVGIQEEAFTFASTIDNGSALGFINQNVPSGLATKLILMDAPLLTPADLGSGTLSAAYAGMAGYQDAWPGASAHRSPDDVTFIASSNSNAEAAWAVVTVGPSAWPRDDNRFQEVADGGTMTILPQRRDTVWVSAADELAVLNGANVMAVISNNGVEIIQFQDVTVNADNTITLDRLLRGRLGTEDISAAGPPGAGDVVVFLANESGVREIAAISKNNILLADLNTALFWRAPTIGTLLEDASSQSFTYTGRDLRPYSVVHVTAVDSAGDKVVGWQRRTRANGEWLDGTGVVPLNESIEQYEVNITDGVASVLHTVNDALTTTFTVAEISGLTPPLTVSVQQISGASATLKSPATTKDVP